MIVGAGLSGIGAAYYLQKECPDRSYVILEGRAALGGTWDYFRYPGIRSDSDMHTLGYVFKPWKADKAIADGPAILNYVNETAAEHGIDEKIRYQHHVQKAQWSSEDAAWTITALRKESGETVQISCNFLFMCSGYFSYRGGYTPRFEGQEDFAGPMVHPQGWPEDLDYTDKRVAVIGSGATAITLVPAMTPKAAHVTMVQRSPTYIIGWPERDRIANALRAVLPDKMAYKITRWKNIRLQQFLYRQTRIRPEWVKKKLLKRARKALGPDFDLGTHLTPRYDPWDERMCLAPDGDFFEAVRSGKASIVTGQIERITEGGIRLQSGEEIPADIIVTATGLNLVVLGEVSFTVDGQNIDFSKSYTYKGLGYSDVPNMCAAFGYVNASWTLRADLICAYVCRLLNHMSATNTRQCRPSLRESDQMMEEQPFIAGFAPGYMKRTRDKFPKQGDREPWLNPQDYDADRKRFLKDPIDDGVMRFTP
jgi:cation diffusion facilitator CzcD-associated flavoprotein CzcO